MMKIKEDRIEELGNFGFNKIIGWNIYRKEIKLYDELSDIKILAIVISDYSVSIIIAYRVDEDMYRTETSTDNRYIKVAIKDLIKADMIEEEL